MLASFFLQHGSFESLRCLHGHVIFLSKPFLILIGNHSTQKSAGLVFSDGLPQIKQISMLL